MALFDLIEYRRDFKRKQFVKVQTHKYNLPRAICESEKRKILFHTPKSRYTRFKIVENGAKQYSNQFKG